MRTKALLGAAAVLAAGAITAQAQAVYSVNIVGYVNDPLSSGQLALVQNPLDDGTNTLSSVIGDAPNGSSAWVWNGSGYTLSTRGKAGWSPDLGIPTGTGFFLKPNGAYTNTYVGQVKAGPGQSITNSLVDNVVDLTGGLIPYAGSLTNPTLGLDSAPNGSSLWQWNGSGYNLSTRGKAGWSPALNIGVGESFFIKPNGAFDWVQTLPSN